MKNKKVQPLVEKLNAAFTPEEISFLFGEACRRYEWLRMEWNGADIDRVADIYGRSPMGKASGATDPYIGKKYAKFIDINAFACGLDGYRLPRLGRILYNTYFAGDFYDGGAS